MPKCLIAQYFWILNSQPTLDVRKSETQRTPCRKKLSRHLLCIVMHWMPEEVQVLLWKNMKEHAYFNIFYFTRMASKILNYFSYTPQSKSQLSTSLENRSTCLWIYIKIYLSFEIYETCVADSYEISETCVPSKTLFLACTGSPVHAYFVYSNVCIFLLLNQPWSLLWFLRKSWMHAHSNKGDSLVLKPGVHGNWSAVKMKKINLPQQVKWIKSNSPTNRPCSVYAFLQTSDWQGLINRCWRLFSHLEFLEADVKSFGENVFWHFLNLLHSDKSSNSWLMTCWWLTVENQPQKLPYPLIDFRRVFL